MDKGVGKNQKVSSGAFKTEIWVKIHCSDMARQGDTIHIPLSEARSVALLGKVKPTEDMPRPGAHATKAKRKKRAKPAGGKT